MVLLASIRTVALGAAAFLGGAAVAAGQRHEASDLVTAAAGWVDVSRRRHSALELGLGYRRRNALWAFRPFVAVTATNTRSVYGWAGIAYDLGIGRFAVTPAFGPGLYGRGGGIDLGYPLEFRSRLEASCRLDGRSRIGVALSHTSNAHLGARNPGVETLTVSYSLALSKP